jgi:hypothetical protein
MDIIVKRRQPGAPAPQARLAPSSPYNRWGEWGSVEQRHAEDHTVDIYLDSRTHLKRVPVASREWVVSGEDTEKGYNSGERNLPPDQARVFVMMPTGAYNDCFIMPFSGFSTIDQTKPYMEDDQEQIQERITPSGWHITDNQVTGTHEAVSPDKKTSLLIDYGNEEEPKKDTPELHIRVFDQISIDVADKRACISAFDSEIVIEEGKPILMRNGVGSLGACIKELLDGLMAFHSEGSAANHVASAWATEKIVPLLTKWVQIFKE